MTAAGRGGGTWPHHRRREGRDRRTAGGRHQRQPHPVRDGRAGCDRRPHRQRHGQHPGSLRNAGWAGRYARQGQNPKPPPGPRQLQEATTRIYEACSFQDITGQRITKVVSTLKTIEAKVASIVATFGRPPRRRRRACRLPARLAAERSATARHRHGPDRHRQASGQLRLMRPAWIAVLLTLAAGPALGADPSVILRTGEHPGFGRVVFDTPPGVAADADAAGRQADRALHAASRNPGRRAPAT